VIGNEAETKLHSQAPSQTVESRIGIAFGQWGYLRFHSPITGSDQAGRISLLAQSKEQRMKHLNWQFRRSSIVTWAAVASVCVGGICSFFVPRSSQTIAADGPQRIIGGTVANSSQFKNVGVLKERTFKFCTGTLIAPNWVLTAGHCCEGITPSQLRRFSFEVGGRNYDWSATYIHPTYNFPDGDIALIKLKKNVTGVTPAVLRTTAPRVGDTMTIVGFGLTGTGASGTTGGAGIKRFGTVRLDGVDQFFVTWNFDSPEVNNTAPGDSGGPGFISNQIVSVCSGGSNEDAGWGDESFNTRTDPYRTWLTNTMRSGSAFDAVPDGVRALVDPVVAAKLAADALPDSPVRTLVLDRGIK
jgi:Trypsin